MIKILAVGDISLGTQDGKHPFGKVAEIFKTKDILFGNLETVLSNRGQKAEKALLINNPPEKVKYLVDAGFDVMNIANNHIMDLGPEGFNETLDVLHENNISFIGAGNHKFGKSDTIIEKNGLKMGCLAYCAHAGKNYEEGIFMNGVNEEIITKEIKELKSKCNSVLVSLHWGIENVFYPSPQQITMARNLIDAGATLVLGHHPHVIQGIEPYKNGLIAYSLGNFQFSETKNSISGKSIILSMDISDKGVNSYESIPTKIDKDFVPSLLSGTGFDEMLEFIRVKSKPIIDNELDESRWFQMIAYEQLRGNMKSYIKRIKKYGIRHLFQFIKWLISPFTLKCYLGLLRGYLRKND